jgi:hypothetical protein
MVTAPASGSTWSGARYLKRKLCLVGQITEEIVRLPLG